MKTATIDPTLALTAEGSIRISGAIHFENARRLLRTGKELISQLNKITIDLQELQRSDTSVLALFTAWVREARRQQKEIIFIHAPTFILAVIKAYGLEKVLPGIEKLA